VDQQGKVQHEIKLKVNHPSTHSDTRLVRKIANGNYLVAHESDGVVREYDATGKIVWEYEVPLFGRTRVGGHGPEGFGNSFSAPSVCPTATPSSAPATATASSRSRRRKRSFGRSRRTICPASPWPGDARPAPAQRQHSSGQTAMPVPTILNSSK